MAYALLTVTNGLLYARQRYLDTDTNNPAVSDTELTRLAARFEYLFHEQGVARQKWLTPTQANGNGLACATHANSQFTTPVNVSEILGAFLETDASTTGGSNGVLYREDNPAKMAEQRLQGTATATGPTQFSVHRVMGALTASGIGTWQVMLFPFLTSGAVNVSLLVRQEIEAVGTGTDVFDATNAEAYTIWDMVAAVAAQMTGQPELSAAIAAALPEAQRASVTVEARAQRPRRGESPLG